MIFRMEARISSMLGSLVASSLVIPHLLEVPPLRPPHLPTTDKTLRRGAASSRVPRHITVAGWRKWSNATLGVIPEGRHSQGKKRHDWLQPAHCFSIACTISGHRQEKLPLSGEKSGQNDRHLSAKWLRVQRAYLTGSCSTRAFHKSICSWRPSSCVMSMPHHLRRTSW